MISASDNVGVVSVTINGNIASLGGTNNWFYNANLLVGTNIMEIIAKDAIGNQATHIVDYIRQTMQTMEPYDISPPNGYTSHNEIVHIPNDIMALALPRSSLLRCGVSIHTAVWDAGYSGRSQSLMVVYNPYGFRLYKNIRIIQLVFFHLSHKIDEGYHGIFQGENI